MRFFNRNNADTAAIPEDLQPYYTPEQSGWRRWVGPVLRGILLLVLLGLLVMGGVWLVNKLTGDKPAPSSQNTAQNDTERAAQEAEAKTQAAADEAKQKADAQAAETKRKAEEAKKNADAAAAETKRRADAEKKKAEEQKIAAAGDTNAPAPAPSPSPSQNMPTPAPAPTPRPASPTPSPSAGGSGGAPTQSPATSTQLPNSGPGEVAALFAAVTATGTLLYRTFLVRALGAGSSRR